MTGTNLTFNLSAAWHSVSAVSAMSSTTMQVLPHRKHAAMRQPNMKELWLSCSKGRRWEKCVNCKHGTLTFRSWCRHPPESIWHIAPVGLLVFPNHFGVVIYYFQSTKILPLFGKTCWSVYIYTMDPLGWAFITPNLRGQPLYTYVVKTCICVVHIYIYIWIYKYNMYICMAFV